MTNDVNHTDSHKVIEDYERLKSNITMFLSDVNNLTSIDTNFLMNFNILKQKYLSDITVY